MIACLYINTCSSYVAGHSICLHGYVPNTVHEQTFDTQLSTRGRIPRVRSGGKLFYSLILLHFYYCNSATRRSTLVKCFQLCDFLK